MKFVVKTLRTAILVTLVSLLLAASGWAQSEQQQSLGDVARQEKAKKNKKVITDEDLPQGTATSGAEAASQSSEGKKEEKAEGGESKEGEEKAAAEGEEGSMTKEQQADEAKKKLEALKADEASYKHGISHFEELITNETDESRRELYRNAMKHGQERLAENLKQQAETEKEAAAKQAAAKAEQQNQPQPEQPPQ